MKANCDCSCTRAEKGLVSRAKATKSYKIMAEHGLKIVGVIGAVGLIGIAAKKFYDRRQYQQLDDNDFGYGLTSNLLGEEQL